MYFKCYKKPLINLKEFFKIIESKDNKIYTKNNIVIIKIKVDDRKYWLINCFSRMRVSYQLWDFVAGGEQLFVEKYQFEGII